MNEVKLTKLENDIEILRRKVETAKEAAAANKKAKSNWWFKQQVDVAETNLLTEQNKLVALEAEIEAEKLRGKEAAKDSEEMEDKVISDPTKDYGIRWHDYVMDWYANFGGVWRKVPITGVKDYLGSVHRIPDERAEGYPSPAGFVMTHAVEHFSVDYAGNYAGYLNMGEYPIAGGHTLLITRGRKLLEAKEGDCTFLDNFLQQSFRRENQYNAFCGWMLWSILSLHQPIGQWSHGQALLAVGDTGIGKTSLQNDIINSLLTNCCADASLWLKGQSTFNEPLGEAEHWLMSDTKSSSQREKDEFLAGVKAAVANVWMAIHPKGRRQINLQTYRRLTITLNEEERALRIVSDLAESEAEKILMLNFEDAGKYAPNGKGGLPYPEWKTKIESQLPAFKWKLLNEFKLPEEMKHPRFGVQYTNPDLLKQLAAPSQKEKDEDLDGMIVDSCFEHRSQLQGRGIEWIVVDRIELQAGQIIDRLIGLRNPARERAKQMYEIQSPRRMTTWLSRLCEENDGQRNGYTIERREYKKGHYTYILIKTPTSSISNNGDEPERKQQKNAPISMASLAELKQRITAKKE